MARSAVFKIVLQEPATVQASVDYATVPGTAVEGEDYTHTAGTVQFTPGVTEQEVRVPVRAEDELGEESFQLVLSNPSNLQLGRVTASVVIPAGVNELEALYPNRNLGVLFYAGEMHPGEGPVPSDTEWTVSAQPATYADTGEPYAGVIGQFYYDVGQLLRAGEGGIQTLSGWWLHYLVQDSSGSTGLIQLIFTNQELLTPAMALDPATSGLFNAWWNAMGRVKVELLDASDVVVASVPMPYPTTDPEFSGNADAARAGLNMSIPWMVATPEAVVKFRIAPNV
jgi:hypothetical protein